MTTRANAADGLEGVVATSSRICYLDGQRGVLAYCGYDIHDLARSATFEEVCYLLWHRRLPTRAELGDLQTELARARPLPEPVLRMMRSLPAGHAMDSVRTLVSALAHHDPDAGDDSPAASMRKAVRLTAQTGALVATLGRLAGGGAPMAADPVLGHAANFLYLLTGERPSALASRAFDVALILHAGPRAERLDVRRQGCRSDTHRHPLGHRGRRGDAEGPASWRRQRRGHEDAHRDRCGCR